MRFYIVDFINSGRRNKGKASVIYKLNGDNNINNTTLFNVIKQDKSKQKRMTMSKLQVTIKITILFII